MKTTLLDNHVLQEVMGSYQDGGDHVGFVEQTEELLLQRPVDRRVHVASLLCPLSDLSPEFTKHFCQYSCREKFKPTSSTESENCCGYLTLFFACLSLRLHGLLWDVTADQRTEAP